MRPNVPCSLIKPLLLSLRMLEVFLILLYFAYVCYLPPTYIMAPKHICARESLTLDPPSCPLQLHRDWSCLSPPNLLQYPRFSLCEMQTSFSRSLLVQHAFPPRHQLVPTQEDEAWQEVKVRTRTTAHLTISLLVEVTRG